MSTDAPSSGGHLETPRKTESCSTWTGQPGNRNSSREEAVGTTVKSEQLKQYICHWCNGTISGREK